jgi:hypothetical protein
MYYNYYTVIYQYLGLIRYIFFQVLFNKPVHRIELLELSHTNFNIDVPKISGNVCKAVEIPLYSINILAPCPPIWKRVY